jgi:hypothetical protein
MRGWGEGLPSRAVCSTLREELRASGGGGEGNEAGEMYVHLSRHLHDACSKASLNRATGAVS